MFISTAPRLKNGNVNERAMAKLEQIQIVYRSANWRLRSAVVFVPRSTVTLDRAQQARNWAKALGNQYVALIEGGLITDVASDGQIKGSDLHELEAVGAKGFSLRGMTGFFAA